jgi:hypothetical protein
VSKTIDPSSARGVGIEGIGGFGSHAVREATLHQLSKLVLCRLSRLDADLYCMEIVLFLLQVSDLEIVSFLLHVSDLETVFSLLHVLDPYD